MSSVAATGEWVLIFALLVLVLAAGRRLIPGSRAMRLLGCFACLLLIACTNAGKPDGGMDLPSFVAAVVVLVVMTDTIFSFKPPNWE